MRVHELAKELGKSSKELVDFLKKQGADVKSHMSLIPEEFLGIAEKNFGVKKEKHPAGGTKEKVSKPSTRKKKKSPEKEKAKHEIVQKLAEEVPLSIEERIEEEYESLFEDSEERVIRKVPKKHKVQEKESKEPFFESKIEKEESVRILSGPVEVTHNPSVKELAEALKIEPNELISKLFSMGVIATINQALDDDTVEILAHEVNTEILFREESRTPLIDKTDLSLLVEEAETFMEPRPPVVTFMGHVDHGKTSLLDRVRNSDVAKSESGGITQHIGASCVETPKGKIVFLDTPGHEAFTAMRAMGANVTDIVVLVVAADDGIMPQTEEALDHAREAEVPIIVAVNKVDKPDANPERVKRQLAERGLTPEEWGGDTICVNVSALTGEGIDALLDMILLQSEILELKANSKGQTLGIIIESEINDKIGPMATAIIKNGTLKKGDPVICGAFYGKVKKMFDDKGHVAESAGPSTPIKIIGLNGAPESGTQLRVVESEKLARDIGMKEVERRRLQNLEKKDIVTLENIYSQIEEGKKKDLKIIIKADVSGSVHALSSSLEKIKSDKINAKIIHRGTGSINDSDIMLADASKAIVVGFHVSIVPSAAEMAKQNEVEVRVYDVIYTVIEEIRKAMEGLLEPETREEFIGRAEVKQKFKVTKMGFVAGCLVVEGKATSTSFARVLRAGEVIAGECRIISLKHFKDDVKEVKAGNECGIRLDGFDDFKEGDVFEVFEKIQKRLTL
ncbi:MAG: translation initiation factor IF-2 [Candidatus Aureabacteria bacterium]|nr:translation initiation factor IF-2 [Candidatus Auribacterota bacterium]